jgi:ribonuclease D
MTDPTILISNNEALASLCRQWLHKPWLTLDTEFVRVNTFYPQLGLIQINDGDSIHLLDPLALSDWGPLRQVLQAPGVIKVLHSASEDLLAFDAHFDCLPTPLFDTQKAAAFLGHGYSLSYQHLVALLLG